MVNLLCTPTLSTKPISTQMRRVQMYNILIHEKTDEEEKRDNILRVLMAQISAGCQQVLNLYYHKACSMAQIADERGLSGAHQAKKAAARCREQLRDLIKVNPILANFLKESL